MHLSDPSGSSALVAAAQWLQGTLLGTIATTIAVIAVAGVGFAMVGGRVSFRHGATVIAGCFLLFGASSIVAGLRSAVSGDQLAAAPEMPPIDASPGITIPPRAPVDPYAGASLPPR